MSTSAWGVDHGSEVSKKDSRRTAAQIAGAVDTGGGLAAIHSGYHAKSGKKLRAAGRSGVTTFGHATAGGLAGGLAGAAITRGKSQSALQIGAGLGAGAGGIHGAGSAWDKNAKMGRYKKAKS